MPKRPSVGLARAEAEIARIRQLAIDEQAIGRFNSFSFLQLRWREPRGYGTTIAKWRSQPPRMATGVDEPRSALAGGGATEHLRV